MPLFRTSPSILPSVLLALTLGLTACSEEPQEGLAPTPNPEASYALGLMAARSLEQLHLSPAERVEFDRGMRDYENGTPRVALLSEIRRVQNFQMERLNVATERERARAEAFVSAAAAEPGAEQLPSGVVFRPLSKTEGATPKATDLAVVRMEGTLPDGLLFVSSEQQGPLPVSMRAGIPCLTEPLARMSVGSKARVTCPPHTGYAASDKPVLIPPGSGLRFEIELIEVKPNPGAGHGG